MKRTSFWSTAEVHLAVLGHHAGMSLEPAMTLAAVLAELAEEERQLESALESLRVVTGYVEV